LLCPSLPPSLPPSLLSGAPLPQLFHLPPPHWTPALHYTYPPAFQRAAKALLLLGAGWKEGGRGGGRAVPPVVWMVSGFWGRRGREGGRDVDV